MNLSILRRVVAAFLLSFLVVSTGCKNTAHGAGKDIEDIGEKIQDKTD